MTYTEELANAIDCWIKAKSTRSLSMLSRLAQVSYSSARRAAQKEVETSQQICLKIAAVIMSRAEYLEFTAKYWPDLNRFIAKITPPVSKDSILVDFMQSEKHFMVLVLASSADGTSREEAVECFGRGIEPYFNEIVDSGCVNLTSNGRWKLNEDFGSPSFELARKMMIAFIANHNRKNDDVSGTTTSWVCWESVNGETARNVNMKIKKCASEIFEEVSDPRNKGNVLVCSGVYSGIMKGVEEVL